jgi:hypothetical protein
VWGINTSGAWVVCRARFAASLAKENLLLVDESHRIGIQDIRIKTGANLIQTASLSKAFGIPAGSQIILLKASKSSI